MNPVDELVHRVNNLLGTIEVQVDVARADGSLGAHEQALRFISESAQRVRADLRAWHSRRDDSSLDQNAR